MNFGIVYGESAEFYHAAPGVTNHRLLDFARPNVPLLFYRKYISKEAPDEVSTTAKEFGEYFHALALEGEAVADGKFVVVPEGAPRRPTERQIKAKKPSPETSEAIGWWGNFDLVHAGKKEISSEDRDLAWKMVAAIRAKPTAKALFDYGKPEVVARFQLASFPIQSRLDWFDETPDEWKRPLIVDVKTIDSLASFDRQFLNYNYYRQAAFYQLVVYEALKLQGAYPRFLFVVVEKNEPFQCIVRQPGEISLDIGRNEVLADLTRLKACYDSGIWPGTPDEIVPVELPEWKQMKGADR